MKAAGGGGGNRGEADKHLSPLLIQSDYLNGEGGGWVGGRRKRTLSSSQAKSPLNRGGVGEGGGTGERDGGWEWGGGGGEEAGGSAFESRL